MSISRTNGKAPTVEEIVRRAKLDERAAIDAIVEAGRHIGRGLAAVVSVFNPKRIYIGGELTAAWDLLQKPIREELQSQTLTDSTRETPVVAPPNTAAYLLLRA